LRTLIIALVSSCLGVALAEDVPSERFVAVRGEVTTTIHDWFLPSAPPERFAVQDRVCRAVFWSTDGVVDVETRFCAPQVAREVRDVATGWGLTVSGASEGERTELFEVWFVYPGRTGPQRVRVLARQAHDLAWTLPADVDPMQYYAINRGPVGFPPAAIGQDTRDTSCRADIEVSSTGLPTDVWVSECDPVFRDHAESALRRWRYETPMLDGAPFRLGLTLGVAFTRVHEGAAAPGYAKVLEPAPPDMQGRAITEQTVTDSRLSWKPPPLPRDTPLFAVRSKPYAEVEVYAVRLPEPIDAADEIECALTLGVTSDRRQQVFADPACPEPALASATAAAEAWMLAPGRMFGGVFARVDVTFVFPGSGTPYTLVEAGEVTLTPDGDWPAGVVARSRLSPVTRVAPKLSGKIRATDPEPGRCVARVEVTPSGKAGDIQIVSCPDVYATPSVRAIRRWRWDPARIDGEPITATTTVSLRYN
jgi:hypothetical protein